MPGSGFSVLRLLCRNCNVYHAKKIGKSQYFRGNLVVYRSVTDGRARDPAVFFFNPEVQKLLKKLTRVDLKKVYRPRRDGTTMEAPQYKFMTTEELDKCFADAAKTAEDKLQIPPVVKPREDTDEELSRDPALQGLGTAKFIFTDITYGVSNKDRLIVVRSPDGALRKANWEERFRMNQIYFPMTGRHLRTPHMFEEEHLKRLLEREEYEYVLDRACIQFEPDDPQYQAVTSAVYSHVDSARKYEALTSTRHFGALAFHLAWNKSIDNLLLYDVQEDRLADAVDLIRLYHILNPEAKSASVKVDEEPIAFIQAYVEQDSSKKSALELALQTYQELSKQRQEVEEGIRRAHGH